MSTSDRDSVETLPEDIAQTLALGLSPVELSAERRDRLRSRVVAHARECTTEGTTTLRSDTQSWIAVAPFIQIKVLRRDEIAGNQTLLIRMQPGGVLPAHRHAQEEEFVVLEGECHVGPHRLRAGDIHIAAAGSTHREVTTRTGVVALVRGEYPAPCDRHDSMREPS